MNKLLGLIIAALIVGFSGLPAFALQKAKPISSDSRLRTYLYSPNEVYVFVGHYKYESSIELAVDEKILTISLGDSTAWQIVPNGNRIFLKPIAQDATTNMTLITDKRTYHFELYAEEAKDIRDEDMVFVVRFIYNTEPSESVKTFKAEITPEKANQSIKPDLSKPEDYNFNYTLSGPARISPVKIFDDGEFTFFQFRNKNATIPAFFTSDKDGNEALINYRVIDDYIVVEEVASQFTLRDGKDIVCVFNETNPLERKPKTKYDSTPPPLNKRKQG